MLKSYKEKQFLVFEFEDGRNVKYNLATGESIGKSGRVVKDVCSQLRGYNLRQVINSFEDENYRNFLNFVNKRLNTYGSGSYGIINVGSFLKKLKRYSGYEQFFSSGLKDIDFISCSFNEVPKSLIKIAKQYNFKLTDTIIRRHKQYPNLLGSLLELDLNEIDANSIIDGIYNIYGDYFFTLINVYNYKPNSLMRYIDDLMTYEGLTNIVSITRELVDYCRMCSAISNKYEKYPKNFLTTHRIAIRNFNRLKKEFNEELFKNRINLDLEFKYDDYVVIYPKCIQDIKDEAIQQNHCVASYIDYVIEGRCHILFLRKKDVMDKSLITLEIRNKRIVQARGKFNRETTTEEKEVLEKYNKKLGGLKVC